MGRFPLAVDLADTVRIVGDVEVELIDDDEALETWIRAESGRFPYVEAARGHRDDLHELRDAVRSLLAAHTTGRPLPDGDLELINDISSRCPNFPKLTPSGNRATIEINEDAYEVFAAEVARSTIEIVSQETSTVARCGAPRCGMFFVRMNPRQRWCSPACGNRARVARHAAKTRPESKS